MKRIAGSLALALVLAGSVVAAPATTLRDTVQAQSQTIEELKKLVEKQGALLEKLQAKMDAPEPVATPEAPPAVDPHPHALKKPQGGFVVHGRPHKPLYDTGVVDAAKAAATPAPVPASPKLQIKTLWYADYANYAHTGFGPQFFDDGTRFPGPGNGGFNAFEVTRAYINFYFSPSPAWTLRITPDIFRQVGQGTADKVGAVSGFGQNEDQQPGYRLKYAFLDYNFLFRDDPHLKGSKATFGQQQNPLVDWEEHLYGYRYTSLTPWNFVSLSSTQNGVAIKGPVRLEGHSKPSADYDVGIYDNGKFSQVEFSQEKQVMARVSVYPWGLTGRDEGLGFTFFGDWGFNNTVPDVKTDFPIQRSAWLAHYNSKKWGLAGEFDWGRNAIATANMFTAVGPQDQFGIGATRFGPTDALAKALIDNPQAHQRGWTVFGHHQIGDSKFELFGLAQWFDPNVHVDHNPFDFRRTVAGVSWSPADFVRFSLNHQDFQFTRDPFRFSSAQIAPFSTALATANPGGIQTVSFENISTLFLNMEFFY